MHFLDNRTATANDNNILLNSVNHGPSINHPEAWGIARQNGRRVVPKKIRNAYNCLIKYKEYNKRNQLLFKTSS